MIAIPEESLRHPAIYRLPHVWQGKVRRVSDAITHAIERHGPDKVCRVLSDMLTPERIARIDGVLAARLASVITVVEDTYDPHNAAATLRTTEALGLQELHAIEPTNKYPVAPGVTRGAHKWIDLIRWKSHADAIASLHARGFKVYATAPGATHSIDDIDVERPIAIAFGNEHDGLRPETIEACDGAVVVPMYGFSESFNLSVTVALAMSRIAARRRAAIGALGDLEHEQKKILRARWFALKIRGADGILERLLP